MDCILRSSRGACRMSARRRRLDHRSCDPGGCRHSTATSAGPAGGGVIMDGGCLLGVCRGGCLLTHISAGMQQGLTPSLSTLAVHRLTAPPLSWLLARHLSAAHTSAVMVVSNLVHKELPPQGLALTSACSGSSPHTGTPCSEAGPPASPARSWGVEARNGAP